MRNSSATNLARGGKDVFNPLLLTNRATQYEEALKDGLLEGLC